MTTTTTRRPRGRPPKNDTVPADLCWRCGMRGVHATPDACIDALRDQLAETDRGDQPGRPRKQTVATGGTITPDVAPGAVLQRNVARERARNPALYSGPSIAF